MAEGGGLASVSRDSDTVYDYICALCDENDLNNEATFYCHQCCQQLCTTCEDKHRNLFKKHQVLGRDKISDWGIVRIEGLTEYCNKHKKMQLEMYCSDHDQVICTICVSVEHKPCKGVQHLPDVAAGIRQTVVFKRLPSAVDIIGSRLNTMSNSKAENQTALQKACQKVKASIQQLRARLNKRLDKMERDALAEMNKLLAEYEYNLQADIDRCRQIESELQTLIKDLQGKGVKDETFSFIRYKQCEEKLQKAENMLKELQQPKYDITFKTNSEVEKYLSSASFSNFETLATKSSTPGHVYTVDHSQEYNVKTPTDTGTCDIFGCCFLENGNILLANSNHVKVKLLSKNKFDVISEIKCEMFPFGVCCLSENEAVAVCVNQMQFINIQNDKLTMGSKVDVDHTAITVFSWCSDLYVGGEEGIFIYTSTGELIKKLCDNPVNKMTHVDSDRIYATSLDDTKSSIVIFNKHGNVLHKFQCNDLKYYTGICDTGSGSVFVCGRHSSTIIQLTVDDKGKKSMPVVATKSEGLNGPLALCFDKVTQQLVVGQVHNDKIIVLQMK